MFGRYPIGTFVDVESELCIDSENDSEDDEEQSHSREEVEMMEVAPGETFVARDGTEWSTTVPSATSFRRKNTVTVKPGPTINVSNFDESVDIFKYLVDDTIVTAIAQYTNMRIDTESTQERQQKENIDYEVTTDEVYGYIGILAMLGVLKKKDVELSEIWQDGSDSVNRIQIINATMSRERFKFLSRYITFDDVHCREEHVVTDPKFFKFREVHDHIRKKCTTAYEPGSHTCVDEELYPFRGRFCARQYMPKKPARYGIKIWELVDSTSKYLFNYDVYLGKEGESVTSNLGEKVVLRLTEPLYNTCRNVTVDNFFPANHLQ